MTSETLPYRLRPCTGADLEALVDLHEACFRPLVETRFAWDPALQRQLFAADPGDLAARASVVEIAGAVAGQLVLEEREAEVFVKRIMIHPRWQGRGLGTRLLEDVVREARQRERAVTLSVWDTNRARILYERLGFRFVRQVEHRVFMRLDP